MRERLMDYGIDLPTVEEMTYPSRKIKPTIEYKPSNIVTGNEHSILEKTRRSIVNGVVPSSSSQLFTPSSSSTKSKEKSRMRRKKQQVKVEATATATITRTMPNTQTGPKIDWVKHWERYYAGETTVFDELKQEEVRDIVSKAPMDSPSLSADSATVSSKGVVIEENDNEIISITSTAAVDVVDKVASTTDSMPKKIDYVKYWEDVYSGKISEPVGSGEVEAITVISSSESESSSKLVTHETRSKMTAESTDVEAATMGRSAFEVGSQTASPLATAGIVSTPTATEMSTTDAAAMDVPIAFSAEVEAGEIVDNDVQEATDDVASTVMSAVTSAAEVPLPATSVTSGAAVYEATDMVSTISTVDDTNDNDANAIALKYEGVEEVFTAVASDDDSLRSELSSSSSSSSDIFQDGSGKPAWILGAVATAGATLQFFNFNLNPFESLSIPFVKASSHSQVQTQKKTDLESSKQVLSSVLKIKPTKKASQSQEELKRLALARSEALKQEPIANIKPPTINQALTYGSQARPAPKIAPTPAPMQTSKITGEEKMQAPLSPPVMNEFNMKKGDSPQEKKTVVYKKPLGLSPVTFGHSEKTPMSVDTGVNVQVAAGVAAVGVASSTLGSVERAPSLPPFSFPSALRDLMNTANEPKPGDPTDTTPFVQPLKEQKKGTVQEAFNQLRYNIAYSIESHMPDVILAVLFWDVGFLVFGVFNKLFNK